MSTKETKKRVLALIEMVTAGKVIEPMYEFYDELVSVQENNHPPIVGLEANVERQKKLESGIKEPALMKAAKVIVEKNQAVIEWHMDYTMQQGKTFHIEELALQTWQNGKIISERYFYSIPK